jgi:hypothetical protein
MEAVLFVGDEAVADAGLGQEVSGLAGVGLDLAAEARHVDVEVV